MAGWMPSTRSANLSFQVSQLIVKTQYILVSPTFQSILWQDKSIFFFCFCSSMVDQVLFIFSAISRTDSQIEQPFTDQKNKNKVEFNPSCFCDIWDIEMIELFKYTTWVNEKVNLFKWYN